MVFLAFILLAYLLGVAIQEEFGEETPRVLVALPAAAVILVGLLIWLV